MNQKTDYLIIGAGIIGLAIARELRSRFPEADITILEKEPDLLVLNPKADYSEMLDLYYRVKNESRTRDIPVVLLMDEAQMRSADLPSGIADVLYRPLRFPEAVMRINFLFKRIHKIDQKDLIRSDSGRSFEKSKFYEMIDQYNRQAKQKRKGTGLLWEEF